MAFPQILEPLQCKIVFNRYLAIGRSNQKISKNKVVLFSNFASGRTLPTQSTGPQPIQLVPKHKSYEMTLCKWSWLTLVATFGRTANALLILSAQPPHHYLVVAGPQFEGKRKHRSVKKSGQEQMTNEWPPPNNLLSVQMHNITRRMLKHQMN